MILNEEQITKWLVGGLLWTLGTIISTYFVLVKFWLKTKLLDPMEKIKMQVQKNNDEIASNRSNLVEFRHFATNKFKDIDNELTGTAEAVKEMADMDRQDHANLSKRLHGIEIKLADLDKTSAVTTKLLERIEKVLDSL